MEAQINIDPPGGGGDFWKGCLFAGFLTISAIGAVYFLAYWIKYLLS